MILKQTNNHGYTKRNINVYDTQKIQTHRRYLNLWVYGSNYKLGLLMFLRVKHWILMIKERQRETGASSLLVPVVGFKTSINLFWVECSSTVQLHLNIDTQMLLKIQVTLIVLVILRDQCTLVLYKGRIMLKTMKGHKTEIILKFIFIWLILKVPKLWAYT